MNKKSDKTLLNLTEIELLQNLAKGDTLAFAHVVEVYQERLLHFSLHYLNNREMAKDVVQDVFAIIWEDRENFYKVNNLSSWFIYTG